MEYQGIKDRADALKAKIKAEADAAAAKATSQAQRAPAADGGAGGDALGEEANDEGPSGGEEPTTDANGQPLDPSFGISISTHVAKGIPADKVTFYNALVHRTVRSQVRWSSEFKAH